MKLNTIYDVQQLLKKFGMIIYLGNRLADLEMMEEELRELYQSQMIDQTDFKTALLLLRQEMSKERKRSNQL